MPWEFWPGLCRDRKLLSDILQITTSLVGKAQRPPQNSHLFHPPQNSHLFHPPQTLTLYPQNYRKPNFFAGVPGCPELAHNGYISQYICLIFSFISLIFHFKFTIDSIDGNSNLGNPVFSNYRKKSGKVLLDLWVQLKRKDEFAEHHIERA